MPLIGFSCNAGFLGNHEQPLQQRAVLQMRDHQQDTNLLPTALRSKGHQERAGGQWLDLYKI